MDEQDKRKREVRMLLVGDKGSMKLKQETKATTRSGLSGDVDSVWQSYSLTRSPVSVQVQG